MRLATATCSAECNHGEEQQRDRSPHKAVSVLAEVGIVAFIAEHVASADGPNSREDCGERLPEESNGDVETREVCAETGAEGEQACEESECAEDQSHEEEGPCEATKVEVAAVADERLWDALSGAKVALVGWSERECCSDLAAIYVVFAIGAADGPVGPTSCTRCSGNSRCVGLEEVYQIFWARCDGARENDKEFKENCCCEQDEGD